MKINKKILIYTALAVIVVVLIIGFILINRAINKNSGPKTQNILTQDITEQGATVASLSKIKNKVFFPMLASNLIDYLSDKGIIFYQYSLASEETTKIWDGEILGATKVIFSPDNTQAIVKSDYPELANTLYNFSSKKTSVLNSKIQDIVWTKENKIIYHYLDGENKTNTINIANADGQNWQEIAKIDLAQPILDLSPDEKNLLLTPSLDDCGANYIFSLDLESKKLSPLTNNGCESGALWNPDSSKIAYYQTTKDSYIPNLYLMDKDGKNKVNLGVKTTTGKIVWQDKDNLIFIANPDLPAVDSPDTIYKPDLIFYNYNLANKQLKKLVINQTFTDIGNLMYDTKGKILYFTSDDELYQLVIK